MKKIIISCLLLLFTIPAFCQLLKPVKLDSLVTVSLPASYQKKDTLGQQIYSANGTFGYMVVIRAVNEKGNVPLKKETDLNKVLKDYTNDIRAQFDNNSSVQYLRDTTIGTLKAKIFTLQIDAGGGDIQYRNFLLIYTTDVTYTFEYGYPNNRVDIIKDEYNAYINSIKFSPQLQRNDQYLSNAKGMMPIVKTSLFVGGGLLLLIAIVLTLKKRRTEFD